MPKQGADRDSEVREATTGAGPMEMSIAAEDTLTSFDVDPSGYLSELAEFDLSDSQKIELIEVLVSIMRGFVELGFSVKNCGQIFEGLLESHEDDSSALCSRFSTHAENAPREERARE